MSATVLRTLALTAAVAHLVGAASGVAQTTDTISAVDLRARLSIFAHDSMEGRATGTHGHVRATDYLTRELQRLALTPKGVRGSFFQELPLSQHHLAPDMTRVSVETPRRTGNVVSNVRATFRLGVEYVPVPAIGGIPFPNSARAFSRAIVFAGRYGTGTVEVGASIGLGTAKEQSDDIAGKIIVVDPPLRENGQPDYQVWADPTLLVGYRGAAAVLVAALDVTPRGVHQRFMQPWMALAGRSEPVADTPPVLLITRATAMLLRASRGFTADVAFGVRGDPLAGPARNVVAMVEGSDPQLKSEFVVLSAHTDHLGIAEGDNRAEEDSVFNGANAGSGAIALLEIAEYVASMPVKPKRSMLFVWTAAFEQGLLGAEFFASHPTVDLGDIVANLNADLLGRAQVDSATGAAIATAEAAACVDDRWHFARHGIPALTLTAGAHQTDRALADDPAGIDYDVYASNTRRLAALALEVANGPRPPRPKGNPPAVCL